MVMERKNDVQVKETDVKCSFPFWGCSLPTTTVTTIAPTTASATGRCLYNCYELKWAATWVNVHFDVHPSEIQISLHIRAVWSESSLSGRINVAPLAIQNAPSEDSDQTSRMRRLIWIFTGRKCSLTLWPNYILQYISLEIADMHSGHAVIV